MMEIPTLTQIISQPALFREILNQYIKGNVDDMNFWYWEIHNPNGSTVSYIEVPRRLKFNLRTLQPCKNSIEQGRLPLELIARIKNDTAYAKFSHNNFSIGLQGCLDGNSVKNMEQENDKYDEFY